jgi:hypothetical protein
MVLFGFSFDAVSKPPLRADGEVQDEVPLLFAGGVHVPVALGTFRVIMGIRGAAGCTLAEVTMFHGWMRSRIF